MRIRLRKKEKLLKKGLANRNAVKGKEGGRLYLTNCRLYFVPYNVDNKNRPIELPITDIEEVDFVRSHGLITNGLIIIRKSGDMDEFYVYGRKKWAKEIKRLIEYKGKEL